MRYACHTTGRANAPAAAALSLLLIIFIHWNPPVCFAQLQFQNRGPGGGGALFAPSINPANDSEYYVACDMSELFHTTNFGASYSLVHFATMQAGPLSLTQFTNNPLIRYNLSYAGNNVSPVKSSDGGVNWAGLAGNPLPSDDAYSLWADPNDSNRLVLAGYSTLFFSKDGGNNFSAINIPINSGTGALVGGAYFDGSKIFLGTSIGMIVSTDGGSTFSNLGTPGIPSGQYIRSFAGARSAGVTRFFCLTVSNTYPGQAVESDYYGDLTGIYSMDNESGSWTPKLSGIDPSNDFLMFIAMAANDINTVYAGGGSTAGTPDIMKTTNAGASWTHVFNCTGNANIITAWSGNGGDRDWTYGEVALGLAVAPSNSSKVVFSDLGFVHVSTNGGSSWEQAYVNPSDQHPATPVSQKRAITALRLRTHPRAPWSGAIRKTCSPESPTLKVFAAPTGALHGRSIILATERIRCIARSSPQILPLFTQEPRASTTYTKAPILQTRRWISPIPTATFSFRQIKAQHGM